MKVLLISHGFQPEYEAGFANGLARNGIEVELVSSDRTLVDRLLPGVVANNLRRSQDPYRPAWRKALNLLRYYVLLLMLLVRRFGVPVHMTGLFATNRPWTWALECWIYKILGHRLILTVHNIIPHDQDTPTIRRGLSKAYLLPDYLIVHTRRARERLISEFGIRPEKINVMEHGIDVIPELSADIVEAARNRFGVISQQRLVVFFGAVCPYKGVDLLLEAAEQFGSGIRLYIAGKSWDAAYTAHLREMMATHPKRELIEWEDAYFSEARMAEVIAAADVIVMPYREIDQSGVLFTALAHGVPVVAFDVGSLKEYLTAGAGVVVPAGDINAFAAALVTIEPASIARTRIQQLAYQYLWENTVKPVMSLYEK